MLDRIRNIHIEYKLKRAIRAAIFPFGILTVASLFSHNANTRTLRLPMLIVAMLAFTAEYLTIRNLERRLKSITSEISIQEFLSGLSLTMQLNLHRESVIDTLKAAVEQLDGKKQYKINWFKHTMLVKIKEKKDLVWRRFYTFNITPIDGDHSEVNLYLESRFLGTRISDFIDVENILKIRDYLSQIPQGIQS